MADKITLDREYNTNGVVIPAGQISTDDLRDLMRDEKGQPLSEEAAKAAAQDLLRRQGKYQEYRNGIHERREYTSKAGEFAVGGGAE